jgi:hypothetical protein
VWEEFSPNSEIKMAGMRQDVGAETVWKNRGIPAAVWQDFAKPFMPKRLMQTGCFYFGVRV